MDEPSISNDAVVVIRPFDKDTDVPMIYSTWRNSAYYSSAVQIEKDNDLYFKQLTKKIKQILKRAKVRVACLEDCPMVILGYAVYTNNHLDWVYVKSDWRNKGIATLLVPKTIVTVTPHLTKVGAVICHKKNLTLKGEY